jgi:hypothetical protein
MFSTHLIAILIATLSTSGADQQAGPPVLSVVVSTPTYFADGNAAGASATFPLRLNQPQVLYAYSGPTLCQSASAQLRRPSNGGYGWRVQVTPVSSVNGVQVQVDWQRLWEKGDAVASGLRSTAMVTLHPAAPVMLDYLSDGDSLAAATAGGAASALTARRCPAIGMGLQIAAPPVETQTVVETDLWLVHTMPDGTERSQRQTIRAKLGSGADYFFDDVKVGLMPAGTAGAAATSGERNVRTFGRILPIEINDGKVRMSLTIAQAVDDSSPISNAGSSTFELTAGPTEVPSFRVPQVVADGGRLVGERLSIRLQVKQIR